MGDPRAIADPPHQFIVQRDDGLEERHSRMANAKALPAREAFSSAERAF